jgi:hypothetical protein
MQLSATLAMLFTAVALAAPAAPAENIISTYAQFCSDENSTGSCVVLTSSPRVCATIPPAYRVVGSITPLESFCYFFTFVFPLSY